MTDGTCLELKISMGHSYTLSREKGNDKEQIKSNPAHQTRKDIIDGTQKDQNCIQYHLLNKQYQLSLAYIKKARQSRFFVILTFRQALTTSRWSFLSMTGVLEKEGNVYTPRVRDHKSRKENPQKLIQLSPRSHPRHLMGNRTAQKDAIKDITSESQVNSYFPYR